MWNQNSHIFSTVLMSQRGRGTRMSCLVCFIGVGWKCAPRLQTTRLWLKWLMPLANSVFDLKTLNPDHATEWPQVTYWIFEAFGPWCSPSTADTRHGSDCSERSSSWTATVLVFQRFGVRTWKGYTVADLRWCTSSTNPPINTPHLFNNE